MIVRTVNARMLTWREWNAIIREAKQDAQRYGCTVTIKTTNSEAEHGSQYRKRVESSDND